MLGDKLLPGTKPGFLKLETSFCLAPSQAFSSLRKPGLVPGKSLSPSTNINSVLDFEIKSQKEVFSGQDVKIRMLWVQSKVTEVTKVMKPV